MPRPALALLLAVCLLSTPAVADDDAPPQASRVAWTMTVAALARTLDGSLPPESLNRLVAPGATIDVFARNRGEAASLLLARLPAKLPVVSARAYDLPIVSAGRDLIDDLQASKVVPPDLVARFAPADDAQRDATLRQADQLMSRWLASALAKTEAGTPVAVLALYDDGHATAGRPTLWFVLAAGQTRDGVTSISQIAYGPMSAIKAAR